MIPAFMLKNPLASGLGILLALVSIGAGVQTLRLAWAENALVSERLAVAKALQKAKDDAQALSDELIIQQAIAMSADSKKAITYVDRIRYVATPDNACPADERMRIGSRGVRDLVRGSAGEAGGGPADGLRGAPAGAGPR